MRYQDLLTLSDQYENQDTERPLRDAVEAAKYGTETISLTVEDADIHIIGDVDHILAVVVVMGGFAMTHTAASAERDNFLSLWEFAEYVWANA